jgi:hypothetical protein
MKIKDLIKILEDVDAESNIFLTYDSFCCVFENFSIAKFKYTDSTQNGLYLCCADNTDLEWHINEDDGPDDGPIEYEILHTYE